VYYLYHRHHSLVIVHLVDYAVVPDANAQAFSTSELATIVRAWMVCEGPQSILYAALRGSRAICFCALR